MILRKYSTIKIGGRAKNFLRLEELLREPERLQGLPHPFRFLGNGSNTLIDDQDLSGSVILCREERAEPQILESSSDSILLEFSAGTYLPSLAKSMAREGWTGTEYLVGVPGTLGGAVVQNAGANDQEVSDILVAVEVLNLNTLEKFYLSKEECGLSYRHSSFKQKPELLISKVQIRLRRDDIGVCESRLQRNLEYRKSKTPYTKASLGSMYTRLASPEGGWIYPGQLIESSGLKGYRIGGAQISELHANYFLNLQDASFEDVYRLMLHTEKVVFEKTGHRLQREIEVWSDRLDSFKSEP